MNKMRSCRAFITMVLPISISFLGQFTHLTLASAATQDSAAPSSQKQPESDSASQAATSPADVPETKATKSKWKSRIDIGYRHLWVSPSTSPGRNDEVVRIRRWNDVDTWSGEAIHENRASHYNNYAWVRNDHYWRKDFATIIRLGGSTGNSSDDIFPRTEATVGVIKKWGKKNDISSDIMYRVQGRRTQPPLRTVTAEIYKDITDNWYAGVGVNYSRSNVSTGENAAINNGMVASSGHSWDFDTGYSHYTDEIKGSYDVGVYIEKGTDISNLATGTQLLTTEPAKSLTAYYNRYLTKSTGVRIEYQRNIAVSYGLSGVFLGVFRTF